MRDPNRRLIRNATALLAVLAAVFSTQATAQSVGHFPDTFRPTPLDPRPAPLLQPGQPLSGLDRDRLSVYRNQIQSRMEDDRLSGRSTTPGGAHEMLNLSGELDRVNGALNRP
ncbi:MAG: hypothetical protein JWL84_3606 [Rhodospirillales bacterium]|jgi:hypothetical protein|nr:hypothetical protein [Rhodospirillales bacterium]